MMNTARAETINGHACLVTDLPPVVEITREGRREIPQRRAEVIGAVFTLVDVTVEVETGTLSLADCYKVHPVWAGVDRPDTGGWGVRGKRTADRLARAVRDLKAITPTAVLVDVNGDTYVEVTHHVSGRYLNADLRKLGY